jgi:hypothetical protein
MPYPQDFVDTVTVSVRPTWYEPEYVTNVSNIPRKCFLALTTEPDYDIANERRKGVMFDLLKQLRGVQFDDTTSVYFDEETQELVTKIRKGKVYKPKPQYYQYFAYTAYALLHGDITKLNWRNPYNGNIQGQDVIYAINKYGIYGLTDPMEDSKVFKKLMLSKFAALYARMFNSDPRFQLHTAEPYELKVEKRESPLSYCGDCGTIRIAWETANIAYKPGHPRYPQLLARFKAQVMQKQVEKSAKEDQERYFRRAGTLLDFDYEDELQTT